MMPQNARPIIELDNVSKVFQGRPAVKDVSFDVLPGQIFGLIGPSGSGKTTLVRMMVGVHFPTSGKVTVLGADPIKFPTDIRAQIGYMPQQPFLDPHLTAWENLSHISGLFGTGPLKKRQPVKHVLGLLHLWDARNKLAEDLSGGMLRRLQLAAVLVNDPTLAFIDEPMEGLDPLLRQEVWEILLEMRSQGKTVLMTTHNMSEAERCNTLALMAQSELIATGTPKDLREQVYGGELVRLQIDGIDPRTYGALQGLPGVKQVNIVTTNFEQAMADLKAEKATLVMVIPENPRETIINGDPVIIKTYVNEIDPVKLAFIRVDLRAQMAIINNDVEERLVDTTKEQLDNLDSQIARAEPQLRVGGALDEDIRRTREEIEFVRSIPTDVLAEPFRAETENVTITEPSVMNFYTPAALALVIQHLAVTLAALSMVRARLLGTFELWQTAPVRLGEIVAGHYLSYGILCILISAIIVSAVTYALYVPVLGPIVLFWTAIALLVLASIGVGFIISLVAATEQTAVQISMIILLGSIFLGGIVQPLEQLTAPVRAVSYLLPATHAVQILQGVVIRGKQGDTIYYVALGIMASIGLLTTTWLFRRVLRPT